MIRLCCVGSQIWILEHIARAVIPQILFDLLSWPFFRGANCFVSIGGKKEEKRRRRKRSCEDLFMASFPPSSSEIPTRHEGNEKFKNMFEFFKVFSGPRGNPLKTTARNNIRIRAKNLSFPTFLLRLWFTCVTQLPCFPPFCSPNKKIKIKHHPSRLPWPNSAKKFEKIHARRLLTLMCRANPRILKGFLQGSAVLRVIISNLNLTLRRSISHFKVVRLSHHIFALVETAGVKFKFEIITRKTALPCKNPFKILGFARHIKVSKRRAWIFSNFFALFGQGSREGWCFILIFLFGEQKGGKQGSWVTHVNHNRSKKWGKRGFLHEFVYYFLRWFWGGFRVGQKTLWKIQTYFWIFHFPRVGWEFRRRREERMP